MLYRDFGKTGKKISALGFGAMRLPEYEKDGKWYIDEDKAIAMIHKGFDLGINYIDTAWGYCRENSQYTVGKALKGYRDKVMVSTKLPMWDVNSKDDFWKFLNMQLERLDVDCIDFYHFHGLNNELFEKKVLELDLITELEKAKEQGMIAFGSFSFHDKPEIMKKIIDTGAFSSVLCQYNLLDRANEDAIAYAHEKGVGTVIMGPVAGGRLAVTSEKLKAMVGKVSGTPEIALRFVLANQNVSCALSGMGTMEMVLENVEVASKADPLSAEEWQRISDTLEETRKMSDLYCTGCDYCRVCPKDIQISRVFSIFNLHNVYGLTEFAKNEFSNFGKNKDFGGDPADCIECGACKKKCPQFIDIPKKLKEAVETLR